MSISAKRRRLQGGGPAGERHGSASPTTQTSTTTTDHSASTSAALTPLTAMDVSELRQDECQSVADAVEAEQPDTAQESLWQGWAELENDPVGTTAV